MKKVLIIGTNSYLGMSLKKHLLKYPEKYQVESLSVRQPDWKEKSFSGIDAIYYVAGIVHQSEKEVPIEKYFEVNCELTLQVAEKAKSEGVKQFIFVSTMSVYGKLTGLIEEKTKPEPKNAYGASKLKAEAGLALLEDEQFKLVVLRPPMIYGKNCTGNFAKLRKLAGICPLFPNYGNERSMLYIENLNIFVEQLIKQERSGLFLPQDAAYVSTWRMVQLIRAEQGKKIMGIGLANPIIRVLQKKSSLFQKIWGTLCYEKGLSQVKDIDYQKYTLEEAIKEIEQ